MTRLEEAAMHRRLTTCALLGKIADLDRALQAAQAVAELDSPGWHLCQEARTALVRLRIHFDPEDE
jgi:hypothetical protein